MGFFDDNKKYVFSTLYSCRVKKNYKTLIKDYLLCPHLRSPERTTGWQKSRSSFQEERASVWTKTTGEAARHVKYICWEFKDTISADSVFLRINSSALPSLDVPFWMTLFHEYFNALQSVLSERQTDDSVVFKYIVFPVLGLSYRSHSWQLVAHCSDWRSCSGLITKISVF